MLYKMISLLAITTATFSTHATPIFPEEKKQVEIASCSMQNGSITHKLIKKKDGSYMGYINFPVGYIPLTVQQEKEQKKKWDEWVPKFDEDNNVLLGADGLPVSPMPSDIRKLAVLVPISSENIFTNQLASLKKKTEFFENYYPPKENSQLFGASYGVEIIDFPRTFCEVISRGPLLKATCINNEKRVVNGLTITKTVLELSFTKSQEIVFDADENEEVLKEIATVHTNFLIQTELEEPIVRDGVVLTEPDLSETYLTEAMGEKNPDKIVTKKIYPYIRSTFTYRPNGDDVSCFIKDKPFK